MDCKRVLEILFLFFDGELEEGLQRSLKDHLSRCPGCNGQVEYTRKLLIVIRERCTRRAAPPRLRHRILSSLPHRRQEWS